jgi:hypothetical protein
MMRDPIWNRAAWRQNTYHTPKPRVMHGPVLGQLGHSRVRCKQEPDSHCSGCGYHVCSCKPKAEPAPSRGLLTDLDIRYGDHKHYMAQADAAREVRLSETHDWRACPCFDCNRERTAQARRKRS